MGFSLHFMLLFFKHRCCKIEFMYRCCQWEINEVKKKSNYFCHVLHMGHYRILAGGRGMSNCNFCLSKTLNLKSSGWVSHYSRNIVLHGPSPEFNHTWRYINYNHSKYGEVKASKACKFHVIFTRRNIDNCNIDLKLRMFTGKIVVNKQDSFGNTFINNIMRIKIFFNRWIQIWKKRI